MTIVNNVEGAERQKRLQNIVEQKLQALQRSHLKFTVSGVEVDVREQVRKVVHAILCAKDFIGVAISAEPHASLAWAGVLIILPVTIHLQNECLSTFRH